MQTVEYKIYSMSYKGMTYVGQTKKKYLASRIAAHRYRARWEDKQSALYTAIREHGFEKFKVEVLATCNTKEVADLIEQRYIRTIGNLNTTHRK